MHQTASVVKKIGEFGTSYLYSAKDDSSRRRSGKGLFIKAIAAATTEQARRAETEVRLLRKLSGLPGIPTIIDCGFSTIEEKFYEDDTEGDRLDARRLYCLLLEPCPDFVLTDFLKKRRRKFKNTGARGLFTRKKRDDVWEGYLAIETILDIFGQMVSAISAIHWFQDEADSLKDHGDKSTQPKTRGIVHLDIQPSRFLVRKVKEAGTDKERYEIQLCSFGCSIRGGLSLTSNTDREEASKLISSSTSPIYRSPEMIDMNLTDELNARYVQLSS
jgi:serine/threonine protein kinase